MIHDVVFPAEIVPINLLSWACHLLSVAFALRKVNPARKWIQKHKRWAAENKVSFVWDV